jgi:PAS domain S-box-containing protein
MPARELRILLLAPTPADRRIASDLLTAAGFTCCACGGLEELCAELSIGAGAVLLTEEVVAGRPLALAEALEREPPWSDVPVLLLADDGADADVSAWAMDALGNVTVLDRPVRVATLVSALRTALRARRRQYELRDHLEAASLLAAIVQSSGDAVIGQALDGRIRSWNASAERLFGYTAAEAVGRSVGFLLAPERETAEAASLDRVLQGGAAEVFETVWLARDGRAVDVSVTLSALRDRKGTVAGVSRIVRDIGERLRAEAARRESEARFRLMADAAPVLIWVSDTTGGCTWFNRSWLEFTGRGEDEELGDGWLAGVHPDDVALCVGTYRTSFEARRAFQMEYRLRRRDGAYRWMLDAGRPLHDPRGAFAGFVGSCIDITERRESEERLHQADRRKDEFLATLGHELRNPLAPIRNGLEILRLSDDTPGGRERLVGMMERQVDHLVGLVDDLLEVSRVSRGRLELRRGRTDLGQIVRTAVESCRPLVERERHRLTLDLPEAPVVLDADPTRLTQVVSNLLNNAAKYTEPGGRIHVAVRPLEHEVEVSVRDTGLGIPAEMLPRVFDMFAQVNRTLGRSQGGLGIGLALVRRLVELHGGWIEARSPGEGQGSEFVFRLPLPDAHLPPPHAAAPAEDEDGARRRVLVVDDNVDAAESLAQLLTLKGHDVRVAFDGLSGVAVAGVFEPDLVFLDIGMPGLDGYEVARRLRREPARPMRLVALTGYGQEEDRRRAQQAGFDGHLVKPLELDALEAMLRPDQPLAGEGRA